MSASYYAQSEANDYNFGIEWISRPGSTSLKEIMPIGPYWNQSVETCKL